MTITICSSVDFTPQIIEIKKKLEAMGHEKDKMILICGLVVDK